MATRTAILVSFLLLLLHVFVFPLWQLHAKCFHESGVVFSAADGSCKFGCDCGQFHPGVGVTEGVYALSSGEFSRVVSYAVPRRSYVRHM